MATLGIDFTSKNLTLRDGKEILVKIWNIPAQERFPVVTVSFYKKANGILIVYDITDKRTFEGVPNWIEIITNNANVNTVKILVGNKKDLEDRREVTT